MGTNYYYYESEPCTSCKRPYEPRHIGKSSGGWTFALHVYPEDSICTLEDWKKLFEVEGSYIENEYGDVVGPGVMVSIIDFKAPEYVRAGTRQPPEFLRINHAKQRDDGLLARELCVGYCIGHGEGSWDYLVGDFS